MAHAPDFFDGSLTRARIRPDPVVGDEHGAGLSARCSCARDRRGTSARDSSRVPLTRLQRILHNSVISISPRDRGLPSGTRTNSLYLSC